MLQRSAYADTTYLLQLPPDPASRCSPTATALGSALCQHCPETSTTPMGFCRATPAPWNWESTCLPSGQTGFMTCAFLRNVCPSPLLITWNMHAHEELACGLPWMQTVLIKTVQNFAAHEEKCKYLQPASWCLNNWMQEYFSDDSFITVSLVGFFWSWACTTMKVNHWRLSQQLS